MPTRHPSYSTMSTRPSATDQSASGSRSSRPLLKRGMSTRDASVERLSAQSTESARLASIDSTFRRDSTPAAAR